MIKNISTDVLNQLKSTFKETDYISKDMIQNIAPYFDTNLSQASTKEKAQWFYNMFKVSKYVDAGLGHAIHHLHIPREYARFCKDTNLYNKLFSSDYSDQIGCTTSVKTSNNVTFTKVDNGWILNGILNWASNAEAATFFTPTLNDNHTNYRVIIDLTTADHKVLKNKFPDPTGLKYARPTSLEFYDHFIPDNHVLGSMSFPDYSEDMFNVVKLMHFCFYTNLFANISALYDEVEQYAILLNKRHDSKIADLRNDVMTIADTWISRFNEDLSNNELYWQKHDQYYMFGKRTLLKVINMSRQLGIQHHLLEGESSRIFRNALTFSSHMAKLHELAEHVWGDENYHYNLDTYLSHIMNYKINSVKIPPDVNINKIEW